MLPATVLLEQVLDDLLTETTAFLCDLIAQPSIRGQEGPVNRMICYRLKEYCDQADLMPIPQAFTQDPDYSWPLPGLTYHDTQNLRLHLHGLAPGEGRSLILNAHTDVVPPSQGQVDPFKPVVREGTIFGRGACDDKGQIAAIYLVLRVLTALGLKPRGDVTIDLVVEEENGGNGTLFMVRHPVKADAAIVMEPTEMKICPAIRGAVWFEITITGRAGHSGSPGKSMSALKLAIKAMAAVERYHDELLAAARGRNRLFDSYDDPMPVTFGTMQTGDWPATAPATAVIKGVFGFLPVYHIKEIQAGIINAIKESGDSWLADHFEIKFTMLNNDGCEIAEDHPLVEDLQRACMDSGKEPVISALTAACDAWRYNNQLGIPTVVMGCGSLWKHAHANNEQIGIGEIKEAAMVLLHFLERWCGLEKESRNLTNFLKEETV